MVGAITVVSQEAAQVLESAGEGPLGKNTLPYFVIEHLKSLLPKVIYSHRKITCDVSGIHNFQGCYLFFMLNEKTNLSE